MFGFTVPLEVLVYLSFLAVLFAAAFCQVEAAERWRLARPATRVAFVLWTAWIVIHAYGRGWFDEISRPAPEIPWALVLAHIIVVLAVGLLVVDGIYLFRRARKRRRRYKIVAGLDARD